MKEGLKIVLVPSTGKTNKYIDILVKDLKLRDIEIYTFKDFFSSFQLFFTIKVFHLNWYENIDVTLDFYKKLIKLLILKLFGKRVIWTFHNKMPHNEKHVKLKKILIHYLFKFSSKIVVHCHDSMDVISSIGFSSSLPKVVFIPHPNYIDSYNKDFNMCDSVPACNSLSLLFVGAVKPYKNLEVLIDVFKKLDVNAKLTICGKCDSLDYQQRLINYVQGAKNIDLQLGFVPDDDIQRLILSSDLLVLPYDLRSSLNSGTVILAFSLGRSVICPNIGTMNEYKHVQNFMFGYDYISTQQHKEILKKKIDEAFYLKEKFPFVLQEYGKSLQNEIRKLNNNEMIIDKLASVYHEVAN